MVVGFHNTFYIISELCSTKINRCLQLVFREEEEEEEQETKNYIRFNRNIVTTPIDKEKLIISFRKAEIIVTVVKVKNITHRKMTVV